MTQIRVDPLTGLRSIVEDRDDEAVQLAPPSGRQTAAAAPTDAPPPLLTDDAPDPPPQDDPNLFTALPARGAHEPIEHASRSVTAFADLTLDEARAAAERWRERMRAHEAAAYVHLGVDEGAGAASRAQLFALAFVPAAVARERERFSAHAVRTMGANLLEDLVQEEVRRRARIVAIDDEAVLMCPYASRSPYQLMLAPRRRRDRFEDDGATGAALLHHGLDLLRTRFGDSPPLSFWVRTAPRGAERFCWRIDVVPRLGPATSLERGAGLAHNPVSPERAARELRDLR